MLYNKIKRLYVAQKYNAFGLVEILISLCLSTFLLFILSTYFTSYITIYNKQRELLNIQQHTHQILNFFQKHITHTGYQGNNRSKSNYDQFLANNKSYYLDEKKNCIIFFYDLEGEGRIGKKRHKYRYQDDFWGFKFENNKLHKYNYNNLKECHLSNNCREWANSCNRKDVWESIFDKVDYNIENMKFNWVIPNRIIQVDITVSSVKYPMIKYQSHSYSYILNSLE